jgi:ketosteroid isomerase-like protein
MSAQAPTAPAVVVDAFLDALARRDFAGVTDVLAPDVRFRALVPSGIREADDADGAVTWLRTWFGAADRYEVIGSGHQTFAGRHRFWYRFALDREGRPMVIDQEGFCDVADGHIHDIALVCSGFQPAPASSGPQATALRSRRPD